MEHTTTILLTTLGVTLAMMFVLWLVSLAMKNASIVDIFWGAGFAVSPDGRSVVSARRTEGLTSLWITDTDTGEERRFDRQGLPTPLRFVGSMAFSADGASLGLTAGNDYRLTTSNATVATNQTLTVDGSALGGQRLVPSARGDRFAVVDRQGSIDVFESRTLRFAGRVHLTGLLGLSFVVKGEYSLDISIGKKYQPPDDGGGTTGEGAGGLHILHGEKPDDAVAAARGQLLSTGEPR